MNQSCEKLSLHFKYCGFIAAMAIVMIATEKWSVNKDFTIYLSNAATMTSLLLGVVAIFYSFISNDGLSRSLGSINTISTEVRGIREEIEEFSQLTQDATDESASNAVLVREASSTLSHSLGSLSSTLQRISEQNETLNGLISVLPMRIDQLETKFGDVAKAIGEKPQAHQTTASIEPIPPNNVEKFLARATLYQNLLSHACVLAATSKKPLSIPMFCESVEYDAPSTFTGFVNCMHAIQLCSRKTIDGKERTYTISAMNPTLAIRSKTYFVEYVEQNYAEKLDERNVWLEKLEAVEVLFA